MSKETVVGKAFDMKILRRIYAFTKPYKKKFYLSVGLTLLLAFLSPLRPILIQYTVDEYIIKLDASLYTIPFDLNSNKILYVV